MPSQELIRAREAGKVPDRIWYALNGKSAWENYAEQKRAQQRKFADSREDDDEPMNIVIEGKVKK